MRSLRLVRRHCDSFYHVVSRIVDRRMRLGEKEKRYFLLWMRNLEKFTGVQVVTYALMSNHFHLLLRVPQKDRMETLSAGKLRNMLPLLYSGAALVDAYQELDAATLAASNGNASRLEAVLTRYAVRRHDLSSFLKDLKQRFTQWYNARHQRTGTLWEGRYKSVLVEGAETTLLTIAAYIDLNAVRAGLAIDPADYRWCGYGEAVAGNRVARRALGRILETTSFGVNRKITWRQTAPRYRMLLFDHGVEKLYDPITGSKARKGIPLANAAAELAADGEISIAKRIRSRIRYFCDGGVLGCEEFVDSVFVENSDILRSSKKTKTGARKPPGEGWGDLRVLRNLRRDFCQ